MCVWVCMCDVWGWGGDGQCVGEVCGGGVHVYLPDILW